MTFEERKLAIAQFKKRYELPEDEPLHIPSMYLRGFEDGLRYAREEVAQKVRKCEINSHGLLHNSTESVKS